jgi:hypothetical protein
VGRRSIPQAPGLPVPVPNAVQPDRATLPRAVASYAQANDIAWVKFGKDDDKLALMRPHLRRQAATGKSGVTAVGVAQEVQRVWTAAEGKTSTGRPSWLTHSERVSTGPRWPR